MRTEGLALKQMSVDDLTEKICVVYYETARNARGDILKGAENLRCTVWAKVLPLTGKISESTPERRNTVTYQITIRYRTDIQPDDEIMWRDRRLKITTPPLDVESRHKWTRFDCVDVIQDCAKF